MDNRTDKNTFFVVQDAKYEKLTVLGPVVDIFNHPLREETPRSYISQGRLWECQCECGKKLLVSEFSLSRGRNKSCGCLRYTQGPNWEKKQKALDLKLKRMEIQAIIKRLSYELSQHKATPAQFRNDARMQECGKELRAAIAKKASIAAQYHNSGEKKRRITNPAKIQHLREVGVLDDWEARALAHAAKEIERTKGLALK